MKPIVIHADRAFTPFEEIVDATLVILGSKIEAVGPRGKVDLPRGAREIHAKGKIIIPGFVDVHIHGAGGHDVMEGTQEALEIVSATVAAHGTTSLVATTVTAGEKQTRDSVSGIAHFILNTSQYPARELSRGNPGDSFRRPFYQSGAPRCTSSRVDPAAAFHAALCYRSSSAKRAGRRRS